MMIADNSARKLKPAAVIESGSKDQKIVGNKTQEKSILSATTPVRDRGDSKNLQKDSES